MGLSLNQQGSQQIREKFKKAISFFALKGPNFNGNLYADVALNNGAYAIVVDEKVNDFDYSTQKVFVVDDVPENTSAIGKPLPQKA